MGTLRCCVLWSHCLILASLIASSAPAVELSQTIPQNDTLVCPGQVLQYTCSAQASSLFWEIGSQQEGFDSNDPVNASISLGGFEAVLTDNDGSFLSSTLTNTMITLSENGQQIQCAGGTSSDNINIVIADVSAICLDRSVIAVCQASLSPTNESEAVVMITLSTNASLMCVESYQVHFNGENKTVPVDSPEANFTISNKEFQPSYEGEIYLLDFEENSGDIPCDFNIPAPTAVEMVESDPTCNPSSQNLTVLFSWTPSKIGGCLDSNVQLVYIIEFNNSIFNSDESMDTSYLLVDVPQGTDLEITITPKIPVLGLIGPPTSTNITTEETECDASPMPTTSTNTYQLSSIATTTTTTTTSISATTTIAVRNTPSSTQTPALTEAVIIVVGALGGVLVILVPLVVVVLLIAVYMHRRSKLGRNEEAIVPMDQGAQVTPVQLKDYTKSY